jgi:hypothetical protein
MGAANSAPQHEPLGRTRSFAHGRSSFRSPNKVCDRIALSCLSASAAGALPLRTLLLTCVFVPSAGRRASAAPLLLLSALCDQAITRELFCVDAHVTFMMLNYYIFIYPQFDELLQLRCQSKRFRRFFPQQS